MKNILLIITLFISWDAFAENKVWFCVTENRAGLNYKEGAWEVGEFMPPLRMIVNQQDNTLLFLNQPYKIFPECSTRYTIEQTIRCNYEAGVFELNPNTKRATSFGLMDMFGNYEDTLSVSAWKCESF
ncbi:hypothetical protein HN682_08660 [Candidatus Peregrinibacteria bacterium]|nr:hypothetical protein [Candidatus Peregrinibacteria bacterium]